MILKKHVAYCTNASRGLSAIAELLVYANKRVSLSCGNRAVVYVIGSSSTYKLPFLLGYASLT